MHKSFNSPFVLWTIILQKKTYLSSGKHPHCAFLATTSVICARVYWVDDHAVWKSWEFRPQHIFKKLLFLPFLTCKPLAPHFLATTFWLGGWVLSYHSIPPFSRALRQTKVRKNQPVARSIHNPGPSMPPRHGRALHFYATASGEHKTGPTLEVQNRCPKDQQKLNPATVDFFPQLRGDRTGPSDKTKKNEKKKRHWHFKNYVFMCFSHRVAGV